MDKLRAMKLYTRLADLGSFAAVAEELDSTASMISKEIRKLEDNLGARLLHRSTRSLRLTSIGEGYLSRCREIIAQSDSADAFVKEQQGSLKGKLRINAPMVLGITDLGRFFAEFMRRYPEVELDIHLGDESIDLVEHGFDLGFRASSRAFDSAYVGKPVKRFSYKVVAAPEYVRRSAEIKKPGDLTQHNCFIYSYFKGGNEWPVGEGVKIKGCLKVNSTLFMRDAIEAGLGIGFLPEFVADPSIRSGALMELLPKEQKPNLTLYALYPNRKYIPPILARCIELMDEWFKA